MKNSINQFGFVCFSVKKYINKYTPLTVMFTVWGKIYTFPSPHSSFNLYSPSDSPWTKFFSRKLHSFSLWRNWTFVEKWGTSTDGFCGSPLNQVLLMGSETLWGTVKTQNTLMHKPASPVTLFSTLMEKLVGASGSENQNQIKGSDTVDTQV